MGILSKNAPPRSVHPLLKVDLLKMDSIRIETILLCKNHISTSAELTTFKAEHTTELMQLESERTRLYNRLRRAATPDEINNIKEQRTALTKRITNLRKDLKLVSGIEKRSRTIAEKLQIIAGEHRQEIARQKLAAKKRNYYR